MSDIFISYKREDKSNARLLAEKLEASGCSVWWDHDLLGGEDYDVIIERELKAAKCVIVIWSVLSIQSRNVKDEARKGLNRDILVPVTFDKTEPPLGFGMTQVVSFANSNKLTDPEYEKLYESVAKKLNPVTPSPLPLPKKNSFYKKNRFYILGGLIVIGILFIFLAIKQSGNSKQNGSVTLIPDSGTDTGSAPGTIDTSSKHVNNPQQNILKFEDKLILLSKDSPGFFKESKSKELGYKSFSGVLDCNAYLSNISLSELDADTIYNCSGKTWTYTSKLIEGADSVEILKKFKEYKIKIEFTFPDLKERKLNDRVSGYHDEKTSIMIFFIGPVLNRFSVQLWIGPQ